MKILLIGASGMIGSRIQKEALSRGHSLISGARSPEKVEAAENVEIVKLDAVDVDGVVAHAANADIILSAVSPRTSGDPHKDAAGFGPALIDAQKRSGKRLVIVGGAGTLHTPGGDPIAPNVPDPYTEEAKAMRNFYGQLVSADIDFTFLAPSALIQPGERTGKFRLGTRTLLIGEDGKSGISAEDYAVAMMDEVEKPAHFRTVFTVGY